MLFLPDDTEGRRSGGVPKESLVKTVRVCNKEKQTFLCCFLGSFAALALRYLERKTEMERDGEERGGQ